MMKLARLDGFSMWHRNRTGLQLRPMVWERIQRELAKVEEMLFTSCTTTTTVMVTLEWHLEHNSQEVTLITCMLYFDQIPLIHLSSSSQRMELFWSMEMFHQDISRSWTNFQQLLPMFWGLEEDISSHRLSQEQRGQMISHGQEQERRRASRLFLEVTFLTESDKQHGSLWTREHPQTMPDWFLGIHFLWKLILIPNKNRSWTS